MTSKATAAQVGGKHYKEGSIQPVEFFMSNPQLDFCEENMIKYSYRHKNKNGLEDLLKVVHYAMLEAKLHYKKEDEFLGMIRNLMGDEVAIKSPKESLKQNGVNIPNLEELKRIFEKANREEDAFRFTPPRSPWGDFPNPKPIQVNYHLTSDQKAYNTGFSTA